MKFLRRFFGGSQPTQRLSSVSKYKRRAADLESLENITIDFEDTNIGEMSREQLEVMSLRLLRHLQEGLSLMRKSQEDADWLATTAIMLGKLALDVDSGIETDEGLRNSVSTLITKIGELSQLDPNTIHV